MEQLQGFINWLGRNWLQICVGLSFVVQITPIKWNPWTALFKWIGNLINDPVIKKLQNLESDVNTVKQDVGSVKANVDENEKDRIRWEILSFANSCRRRERHTKEEFVHVINLRDKYELLLRQTGDTNGVFEEDYSFIKRLYAERLEKNDFLL